MLARIARVRRLSRCVCIRTGQNWIGKDGRPPIRAVMGNPSGELALRLPSGHRFDPAAAAAKAKLGLDAYRDGRPVILSEENIPGRMFNFLQGQFYPFAEIRCAALRTAWTGPIAHLMLVVRPYDQLFESAFRKRAEDNEMSDFSEVVDNYMDIDRGWPELVQVMQDVLKPEAMTVVPYEARGTNLDLLGRLVPSLATDGLVEPQSKLNQSATDSALEELQIRYRRGESLSRSDWQAVIQHHVGATHKTGFATFADEEKAELSARYASDLKQIEWMPGINFA